MLQAGSGDGHRECDAEDNVFQAGNEDEDDPHKSEVDAEGPGNLREGNFVLINVPAGKRHIPFLAQVLYVKNISFIPFVRLKVLIICQTINLAVHELKLMIIFLK